MTERRPRCVLYLRQSLGRPGESEDTSLSLEMQEARLRERAKKEGWVVVETVKDHDLKGDDPDRPGIGNVMQLAKAKAADIVLVFAMSRFARDQVWQEVTYQRLTGYGVQVVSLNEPNIEHTLFRGVLGVVNQYASEQTAQFVRAAFSQRIERGLTHGPPPYGYRKVNKQLVIDEDERPLVTRAYELWLAGKSVLAISEIIAAEGIAPRRAAKLDDYVIRYLLKNPVYAGYAHINGRRTEGRHEPIIDRETWERAQELFERRPRMRHGERPSWCEGLVYHECGERMYLTACKNRPPLEPTWRLSCRTESFPRAQKCGYGTPRTVYWKVEDAARTALARDLAGMLSTEDVIAEELRHGASDETETERKAIDAARATIANRLRRAEDLYLTGMRDAEWLAGEEARAAEASAELDTRERRLPARIDRGLTAAAAGVLSDLAQAIPDIGGDDLRAALETVGVIIVTGTGATIRYHANFANFVPEPAVIPLYRGTHRPSSS